MCMGKVIAMSVTVFDLRDVDRHKVYGYRSVLKTLSKIYIDPYILY